MEANMIMLPLIAGLVTLVAVVVLGLKSRSAAQFSSNTTAGAGTKSWMLDEQPLGLTSLLPISLRTRLITAGLASPTQQMKFVAVHVLLTISGAVILGWMAFDQEPSLTPAVLVGCIGGAIGWWLPNSWLEVRLAQRRIDIVSEFPVMLDLLQISVQGGLGLSAAWLGVAKTLRGSGDALAQEMRLVELEVGFGAGWRTTLEATTERTGVTEFRSLGALLEQTDRFGTGLSHMIQVLSDSLRHEELQVLEERAHQASVKMLFPLAAMMMPATLLLIVGPLLLMLFEALQGADVG